jgi:hypothetical protein
MRRPETITNLSRRAISVARIVFLTLKSLIVLPWGIWRYRRSGTTPESAYQALIWLFCVSGGWFNDLASSVISRLRPKVDFGTRRGVLGDLSEGRSKALVEDLKQNGFLVFPAMLPADVCDRLMTFALTTKSTVRPLDNRSATVNPVQAVFDQKNPIGVRYDYSANDLLRHPDVQALMADGTLLEIAQEYFNSRPLVDVLWMGWSTAFGGRPNEEAAQYYHFDMDRIKWLKVFIYLTDVTSENGPHSFVKGTHRTGQIPSDILYRGYGRLSDEDIAANYPNSDVYSFAAPRGSIIIEDTRGLHKGVAVKGGPRLMMQVQFSNSLFGASYPSAKIEKIHSEELKAVIQRTPEIFRQYY